jgi:hypothetical protein
MPIKYGITFITRADDNKSIGQELWRLVKPKEKVAVNINQVNRLKCFGDKDGVINASASGGFPPYKFIWSNGGADSTLVNLAVGNYKVTVEDFLNFKISSNFSVNQPTKLSTTVTATKSKIDLMQGTVNVSASGGSSPYNYKWNTPNNDTLALVKNLNPGTYLVTITDANGCTKIDSGVVDLNTANHELLDKDQIIVSPNPTSKELYIQLVDNVDCNNAIAQCYNLQGKLVKSASINCENSSLNVSELPAGFYLLLISDQHKTKKAKFVKID